MGRTLKVDHTRYKRKDDEEIVDNAKGVDAMQGTADHDEGQTERRRRTRRAKETRSDNDGEPVLKGAEEHALLVDYHDDEDPMKDYLNRQREEDEQDQSAKRRKDRSRSHRDGESRHHHRHHHRRKEQRDDEKGHRHHRLGDSHHRAATRTMADTVDSTALARHQREGARPEKYRSASAYVCD